MEFFFFLEGIWQGSLVKLGCLADVLFGVSPQLW